VAGTPSASDAAVGGGLAAEAGGVAAAADVMAGEAVMDISKTFGSPANSLSVDSNDSTRRQERRRWWRRQFAFELAGAQRAAVGRRRGYRSGGMFGEVRVWRCSRGWC
jgi:hypothetical protein